MCIHCVPRVLPHGQGTFIACWRPRKEHVKAAHNPPDPEQPKQNLATRSPKSIIGLTDGTQVVRIERFCTTTTGIHRNISKTSVLASGPLRDGERQLCQSAAGVASLQ